MNSEHPQGMMDQRSDYFIVSSSSFCLFSHFFSNQFLFLFFKTRCLLFQCCKEQLKMQLGRFQRMDLALWQPEMLVIMEKVSFFPFLAHFSIFPSCISRTINFSSNQLIKESISPVHLIMRIDMLEFQME